MTATPTAPSFLAPLPAPSDARIPPLGTFLAAIPDPRRPQGRRHSLPAILSLLCAALLCGVRGYQAVAQWGRLSVRPYVRPRLHESYAVR